MGKNTINGQEFTYDDQYSHKDFTGRKLLDAKDLNGITIFGSCFSHEIPDTKVFPDIEELTLINCNTDNIYIDPKWKIIGCSNRRFQVQTDLMDWEVDKNNKPIKPLQKEEYLKLGLSINPIDLPKEPMEKNIIEKKKEELDNE